MYDALNSLMCASLFISQLDGLNVHAFGSVDRLIQPFYQRDLEAGRITKEEAYYLIQCFLYKTDAHIHYNEEHTEFDNGVTVMVGGCDPEGNPIYNAVTDLILRAYLENKFVQPKLNARAGTYSPRAYLEKLAELIQSGLNNLIIQNDDYIVPMFQRMGLSPEDARRYIGGGCQEVVCTNQIHSRAFFYLNLPQILLDTLAGPTQEIHHKLYRYGQFRMDSFQELQESFLANLRSYIRLIAETFAPFEQIHDQINPEPLLSCFTADCVSRGQDITQGGAKYYHKTLSLFGFGTLCDSLLRLQESFENGSTKQLLGALEANFEGNESLRLSLLHSNDRFGHSEKADAFAKELANALAKVSRGIMNGQGIEWNTSLFTYYTFQTYGKITGATPDGRRAGEPLSRQMNMASLPVLTAAATSMAALTEAQFNDVGMFDFSLPYVPSDNTNFRSAVTAFLLVCLKLKIPVLQSNMSNPTLLKEERDHKGTHPDLIVRICGYSALFTCLSKDVQNEVIARAQG
jgi:formate C-acetyltransferase